MKDVALSAFSPFFTQILAFLVYQRLMEGRKSTEIEVIKPHNAVLSFIIGVLYDIRLC